MNKEREFKMKQKKKKKSVVPKSSPAQILGFCALYQKYTSN